ncbi:cellulose synthase subunit BcsC-related outer membrane protein, partial [Leptospira sp. SA-E8]|uniref:cellulose synthase subunit BcsC-related outer membrane protein n=1 Tax=Leptospira sp. SA-E8 TaxID=3422259 RepID=UPI003EBB4B44
ATEIPLELKFPESTSGRWALRADLVRLDAGTLDLSKTYDASLFGSTLLCQPTCDSGRHAQQAEGVALNVGLERGATRYDLGTTPIGFPVQSWVGGILHKGDLGPFGYSLDVSRRPVTASLLSYAGTRDVRTGRTWGGVQATGARLGLSLDEGGRFGGWSSLGWHRLSGQNVLDNDRHQLDAV